MLVLALPFVALTETHYDRWEFICVKDKALAYTRGAIKGLHKLLEGVAGMGRLPSLLPIKKNIPLLPNSARGAKGANFPAFLSDELLQHNFPSVMICHFPWALRL